MSIEWQLREVPIKFSLSDKTLFTANLRLQVREIGLSEEAPPVVELNPPSDSLEVESQGFLIRSLPVAEAQPKLRRLGAYLCYVPHQYQRYYVDLQQSFAEYRQRFSSKTRSTINRKLKKYAEHCGGEIRWRAYTAVNEMPEFFRLARMVSEKTYQERLFDAGLPSSIRFVKEMESLATEDRVRAFILFDGERPVSYLYCPIHNRNLIYQYLGYDPGYMDFSVGTVLQWLALERLFSEGRFRLFDFTEGQSDHKRLFATNSIRCANVFFLRKTLRNAVFIQIHKFFNGFSAGIGELLSRFGLKSRIRKILRFSR